MNKNHSMVRDLFVAATYGMTALVLFLATPSSSPAEAWKETFDEICSKVQGSDALSVPEMEELIKKADRILPEIQASNDPAKKVYLQRLKKCRALYEFMIETRKTPSP